MDRARAEMARADLVLWLGPEGEGPERGELWEIEAQIDRPDHPTKLAPRHRLSAVTGEGVDRLRHALVQAAQARLPQPGAVALNARQHGLVAQAGAGLAQALAEHDLLLVAENLRLARDAFDHLLGGASTEDMLDALFGRFCIGK